MWFSYQRAIKSYADISKLQSTLKTITRYKDLVNGQAQMRMLEENKAAFSKPVHLRHHF